ncbi:MAG: hypothetical protein ABII18_06930 [bacterium]|nr:hypothetical protein [bacterium]MBU1918593.1 hypothetical protein [bacterium]
MTKVTPFPFDKLPQFTKEDIELKKRLLNAYYFVVNRPYILKLIAAPLEEIFGQDLDMKVTHVEKKSYEDVLSVFSDQTLLGVVRIEPHGKKAGVFFDTLLAKLLIQKVLTNKPADTTTATLLQLKPLTALEEAVVQYLLVSIIEKVGARFNDKNFNINYEDVIRNKDQVKGSFSQKDEFVLFSLKLTYLHRDFYVQFLLPLTLTEDMESVERYDHFINHRIKQFENFTINFQLEVARVTLEPEDVDVLSQGDIILFDEAFVEKNNNKITGQAELKMATEESQEGYLVSLETQDDVVKAKIESTL